jgi:hypothetical protein
LVERVANCGLDLACDNVTLYLSGPFELVTRHHPPLDRDFIAVAWDEITIIDGACVSVRLGSSITLGFFLNSTYSALICPRLLRSAENSR